MSRSLREHQTIAGVESPRRRLAGGELEDLPRASAPPESPGADVRRHSDDAKVTVEEHHVDREAHEPRVDRRARIDQQPFVARELPAAEEAAKAREEAVCDHAPLADDPAVRAEQPACRSHVGSIQSTPPVGLVAPHSRQKRAGTHSELNPLVTSWNVAERIRARLPLRASAEPSADPRFPTWITFPAAVLTLGAVLALAGAIWVHNVHTLRNPKPIPITVPPRVNGVVWGHRVFVDVRSLRSALTARGVSYQAWARRHPTAKKILRGRTHR